MTEPPDPRHSEEGGGDEDYDAIWENADADEIMSGLEDDALLDSIAQGVRGDLGPDQLTELLSGLRDKPDATDIPVPNLGRVERGENVLEPPGPRQSTERNTPTVSAQEEAARLMELGNSQYAQGLSQQIIEDLTSKLESVTDALGPTHTKLQEALGPIQQALDTANTLSTAIAHAMGNLKGIAGQLG